MLNVTTCLKDTRPALYASTSFLYVRMGVLPECDCAINDQE